MKSYTRLLTIAGSDSGGGAGIQADLKTFAALGCYGMSAITCVTAQNTQGVSAIHPIDTDNILKQIEAVISDIGVDAIKIGLLNNPSTMLAIADKLRPLDQSIKIVLDPVMVATSGDVLLNNTQEAIKIMKHALFPIATLITPNLDEAKKLIERDITTLNDMAHAAKELSKAHQVSVLVKGGHQNNLHHSLDCLYQHDTGAIHVLKSKRIHTKNTHGTGCTLSSAIAAFLAKGDGLLGAVKNAKHYLDHALKKGALYHLGQGHGPVHHQFEAW